MNPFPPSRPEDELYVETDFKILFEDESLLVADKPAPLPVHKVGAFKNKNLLSLLQQKFPDAFLAPVNRLDSETSGLVIFAKTSEMAGKLGLQFEMRTVEKEYKAFVFGHLQDKAGTFRKSLGFDESLGFRRRIEDRKGESAETDFELLETRSDFSLVLIKPKTGRTHQIRVHFSLAGHPLVGDKIYINPEIFEAYIRQGWQEEMRETVRWQRLALHASGLKIKHPVSGKEMKFNSEMPESLMKFWKDLPV